MDTLYPNLYERFKSEGLCPICLMEMELAPRYTCENQHTICYRCKPYYYSCPTCLSPFSVEMPASHVSASYVPPPTHYLPHPFPPKFHDYNPSAPSDDFLGQERTRYPPTPHEDQEPRSCSYTDLGCWVKVPEHLADLHESRCQFRPHLEEESLPTDVAHIHDDLVECKHRIVGCKVKTSPWRIAIHENYCAYKARFEAISDIAETLDHVTITDDCHGDSEELVECKFRKYGCMVNMPRRRKHLHQEKCNYKKYYREDDDSVHSSESEYEPDEQVACIWAEHGCRVRPKRSRAEQHQEKCNYRMEECTFKDNGCSAVFHPSRKYAHERTCEFCD
ncbi:uncharacterized protein LOC128885789 [Hylaeus anthracinus]|uniref:uncharacterized protein LOC128885789 n=1 Tax=Hylaeus anthracinus TaxID=313031 RepID=UPI0023BA210C|nr:uncharacterized protein LOC128885789 [Hylaeus anthracinus]XP_053996062.1 uncharacterized protein LOC128885789 [Hylaeus anthracinus]